MTKKNPYNFYEVTILYNQTQQNAYNNLLETSIFPSIDELTSKKLIDNYHFLSHSSNSTDLRISISDKNKLPEIMKILKKFGISGELNEWGHGRLKVEDDILKLNTEITRLLLNHPSSGSFYPLVVHYQNNSYGMGNLEEANFLFYHALKWLITINVNKFGMEREKAIEKAKKDLKETINNTEFL